MFALGLLASILLDVHFCMTFLIESFRKQAVEKGKAKLRGAEEKYQVPAEAI